RTLAAAQQYDVQTLFVSGGVAANRELRAAFERNATMEGLRVFFPSRSLSTDNAAMIAAAAFPKFLAREFVAMTFSAEAAMALKRWLGTLPANPAIDLAGSCSRNFSDRQKWRSRSRSWP